MSENNITTNQGANVLEISGLNAWYGDAKVLHGVDVSVEKGQLVALVGRNGSGRTTTLKSILGTVPKRTGQITIRGKECIDLPSHEIVRFGKIGYCPEERGVFSKLTVDENLLLPPRLASSGFTVDELFRMFPNLEKRRTSYGHQLSGGEQQMLALARILRAGADFLILDEITEGLAPIIVKQLGEAIVAMKNRGMTILLVEQNFYFVAPLVDQLYILEEGRTVMAVKGSDIDNNMDAIKKRLGI